MRFVDRRGDKERPKARVRVANFNVVVVRPSAVPAVLPMAAKRHVTAAPTEADLFLGRVAIPPRVRSRGALLAYSSQFYDDWDRIGVATDAATGSLWCPQVTPTAACGSSPSSTRTATSCESARTLPDGTRSPVPAFWMTPDLT